MQTRNKSSLAAANGMELPEISYETIISSLPNKASTNIDIIPEDLKELNQWVLWKLMPAEGGKKPRKVPHRPSNPAKQAKCDDSSTWGTFKEAEIALALGKADGIGFQFTAEDPYVGFDMDACVDENGRLSDEAQRVVALLNSYTEYSQSGKGIHIILKGTKPGDKCKVIALGMELYEKGRGFWLTGNRVESTPEGIEDRQEALNELYGAYFEPKPQEAPAAPKLQVVPTRRTQLVATQFGDDELLDKARSATNGGLFESLYDSGVHPDPAKDADPSSKDMALLNLLAFWTGCDPEQMERLFNQSALASRDKWQNRAGYRERSIREAIEGCSGVYDPTTSQTIKRNAEARAVFGKVEDNLEVSLADAVSNILSALVHSKGRPENRIDNYEYVFRNDPALKQIWYDSFSSRIMMTKREEDADMWDAVLGPDAFRRYGTRELTGIEEAQIKTWLEKTYLLTKDKLVDRMLQAHLTKRDSIREIIESQPWDGVDRVADYFINTLGVEDTILSRIAAITWFKGAIARVYEPGCKFDYMLLFIGDQGIGKSKAARRLALSDDRFTDDVKGHGGTVGGKESSEKLLGKWIVEWAEMAGMRKTEVESIKSFVTATTDEYRTPYETRSTSKPRKCVFIGTSNDDTPLKDMTGNRRFWPMFCAKDRIKRVSDSYTKDEIQQIWAEAKHLYNIDFQQHGKAILWLSSELENAMAAQQETARQQESWEEDLERYCTELVPANWHRLTQDKRYPWLHNRNHTAIGETQRAYICPRVFCEEAIDLSKYNLPHEKTLKSIEQWLKNKGYTKKLSGIKDAVYGSQRNAYERK